MATHLDLQEQEQLDQIKDFWKRYGNLITSLVVLAAVALAAVNGWRWWERNQAIKAAAMYEELDKAAAAGDVERAVRVFEDLKERFPRTAYAGQAGLLAAKLQFDKGQVDGARASLAWVGENATEAEYRTIARMRLAGILLDQKNHEQALKQLEGADAKGFEGLVADRRGDVLTAQGKKDEATAAYRKAWESIGPSVAYRRIVEAKLIALGAAPDAAKTDAPQAGAADSASAKPDAAKADAARADAGKPDAASAVPATEKGASK
jgi:predicted negative regulator of RcsB-dependent stress response